jgi:hypothetical protein
MSKDYLQVTVGRINEGWHQDPEVTQTAYSVQIRPDGSLVIESALGGRSFSAGAWDSVEVKRTGVPDEV